MKTKLLLTIVFLIFTSLGFGQTTNIPDSNFENYLETHDKDGNTVPLGDSSSMGNGVANDNAVSTNRINTVTTLNVNRKNISDLTGIEDFTDLRQLYFSNNNVSSIDLRSNSQLGVLYCENNNFSTLDITSNSLLQIVTCQNNNLTNINIFQNKDLHTFYAYNNNLEGLNTSGNSNLKLISIGNNNIEVLDVSKNNKLENLYCENNSLKVLNVANGTNSILNNFYATNNPSLSCIQIDNLNAVGSNWKKDTTANYGESCFTYIPNNSFEQVLIDLNLDDVLDNYVLTANISNVTSLDLSRKSINDITGIEDFTALESLNIAENSGLGAVDFSKNLMLKELIANFSGITSIDITKNTLLEKLNLRSSFDLTNIDLSNNTALKVLTLVNCQNLATLDITNNLNLEEIDISLNSKISVLNTSNLTKLKVIAVSSGLIETLDISNSKDLENIYVSGTKITTLDISDKTKLTELDVSNTLLTSLDLKGKINLSKLNFDYTNISEIDISENTNLEEINFNDKINTLDTSKLTKLERLIANVGCNVEVLDLGNSPSLTYLYLTEATGLKRLNLNNGNNQSFTDFNSTFIVAKAFNLTCVQVDDPTFSAENWKDNQGNSTIFVPYVARTDLFSFDCFTNSTFVPDDNFEQALIDLGLDDTLDDYVKTSHINTVTNLNIDNKNITDVTGIEDFTALQFLGVNDNNLTTVNLSNNLDLDNLSIYNNNLTSLDVTKNTKLFRINCDNNQITNLDLSKNVVLNDISCSNNKLISLNIKNGNNTNITYFSVLGNPDLNCVQVDDVNLFEETNLFSYSENCRYGQFEVTDTNFEQAIIAAGLDTDLDGFVEIDSVNKVTDLFISNYNISNLNGIEYFVSLLYLDASNNNLTSLDISKNIALELLYLSDNNLSDLDLFTNKNITYLSIANNALNTLDVSQNTMLGELYCSENQLTNLDLSKNTELFGLFADNNNLTTLNLKNGNNSNFGRNFDVSNNPNLTCIQVDNVDFAQNIFTSKDATASFSENCSGTASILDNEFSNAVYVYPNPVKDILKITINNNQKIESVQLFNVIGKKILEQKNEIIDFSNLTSGIYILKLKNTNGNFATKKVIKR